MADEVSLSLALSALTESKWFPLLSALAGVVVGGVLTWFGQDRLAQKKFVFDIKLAERKSAQERAQLIHKRQFELADALLTDAYRFRDLMAYARNAYRSCGTEGGTREADPDEDYRSKLAKDRYFVPIERLQKESEFISSFMAKRHSARALFGQEVEAAFSFFDKAISEVRYASAQLVSMPQGIPLDRDGNDKFRRVIWTECATSEGKADELGDKIQEGVLLLENLCKPFLEWRGA